MAKYKVGDKVRVRIGLKGDNNYGGVYFAHGMEQLCGKEFIVSSTFGTDRYSLDGDAEGWTFAGAMLEAVTEKPKSHKYKVGDKVRVRTGLQGEETYGGVWFPTSMERYCGKEMSIKEVLSRTGSYKLVDGGGWTFSDEMLEIVTDSDEPSCEQIHTQTLVQVTVHNHWWCPTHGVEAVVLGELIDGTVILDLGFKAPFTHTCNGRCKSGTGYYDHKKNIKPR